MGWTGIAAIVFTALAVAYIAYVSGRSLQRASDSANKRVAGLGGTTDVADLPFRDRVLGRHVMGPAALEAHNANEVGGDIAGGISDWRQMAARPRLSLTPWATPDPSVFLCSSSTPPGGGVHGMCGRTAAQLVLKRLG